MTSVLSLFTNHYHDQETIPLYLSRDSEANTSKFKIMCSLYFMKSVVNTCVIRRENVLFFCQISLFHSERVNVTFT